MLQKHCKEEEEEEPARDLNEKRTYFVMFSFEKDIIRRHTYYPHNPKKATFFSKGVQGIRRQEIAMKRLCILKELITHTHFLLVLEILIREQTWYIEK